MVFALNLSNLRGIGFNRGWDFVASIIGNNNPINLLIVELLISGWTASLVDY